MWNAAETGEVLFDSSDANYGIWMQKPQSVVQRRESFLRSIGFIHSSPVSETSCRSSPVEETKERTSRSSEADTSLFEEGDVVADDTAQELVENSRNPSVYTWRMDNTRTGGFDLGREKVKSWLNRLWQRRRTKAEKKKKKKSSGFYVTQELKAHHGYIWTLKFSRCNQYLASGGDDGVVRIWLVGFRFSSEILALQELSGHRSRVLDLAWSGGHLLLSSSMDKTVRLWRVGSRECMRVFRHNNYVTCVQFNPVDDNRFITGSVDGKVRIWGVSEGRVVDWIDGGGVVTAICHEPLGKGFAVGFMCGTCRFYRLSSDGRLVMDAKIRIHGRRRALDNKITSIEFCPDDSRRALITSDDSRVRVVDGSYRIRKYKGLRRYGSIRSASFTSSGKRIVLVGEGSRVYICNYEASRGLKLARPCMQFSSDNIFVPVPWPTSVAAGQNANPRRTGPASLHEVEAASSGEPGYLPNRLGVDGANSRSATWPEEKLPSPGSPGRELVTVAGYGEGTMRIFSSYGSASNPCCQNRIREATGSGVFGSPV